MTNTVDPIEIQDFSRDSHSWWDEDGPFAPLHQLNPVRLSYIKKQLCTHFARDEASLKPFKDLTILDIGCGGGLVCEPLARLGADVTGVDADAQAIEIAQDHAKQGGLEINYVSGAAEDITRQYDIVLALEIIEHVSEPALFVAECARLVKPGGLAIFSTLNRTARSFALGIVAAEYVLRWVPRGTHSWRKFIKPSELGSWARNSDLKPQDVTGLIYNPLSGFCLSQTDLAVNYLLTAQKT